MSKQFLREATYDCKSTKQLKKVLKRVFKDFKVDYTGECAVVKDSGNGSVFFKVMYSEVSDDEDLFADVMGEPKESLEWVHYGKFFEEVITDYVKKNFKGKNFVVIAHQEDIAKDDYAGALMITIICNAFRDNNGNILSEVSPEGTDLEDFLNSVCNTGAKGCCGCKCSEDAHMPSDIEIATELLARSFSDCDPEQLEGYLNSVISDVKTRLKEIESTENNAVK